jgi:hypothetical protein
VVPGARIEITGEDLPQAVVLRSDDTGKFTAPDLKPGKYSVRVLKEGFEEAVIPVELSGSVDLEVKLTVAEQQVKITVTENNVAFLNSDVAYRQLRDIGPSHSYHCENFTLPVDVGTFQLISGTLTFLPPVNRYVTGAIFVGRGHFVLKPVGRLDTQEMIRRSGGSPEKGQGKELMVQQLAGRRLLTHASAP